MKFTSIRLRVILLVIAMAVPIVLLGIGGTLYYQSILKQNIWDDELNMAKTISVMTPEYMNSSQLYLKSVADRPLVIKAMEDNDTAYLSSQAVYANETDRINSAYFTDNKGNVIASTQNISSMIGSNVKNRSYMGDVLRTGDPVIGDGEPGYDKMPVVPIGLPIKDGNGTILGVLVGTVDLNVYSEMIRETAVKDQQIVYQVNRTGHIMIHNNPQYVRTMANFSSVQSVQDMLQGESGVTEYYNPIENVTQLGAYVPIEPMGWGVVVALPTSIAYQPAWNAGYLFVGGTALLTLGAILLGLFLANGITSPILRLSLATKKISSKSDYAQLIPLDRKDEIGDLAHSFKGMVDDIQNKQEELEVQNEETRENNLELQKQILERKRAEEALRESEQRFRATFEQAAVGIAQLDPDGRFIRINERYCDIVGYTHDEMLERTFQDITYPADLEENQRNVQRLLDGEITTYAMEKRYVRKDGSPVWVYLTVSLEHNEDGSPKYLIAIVEDITERKQAEEALRESEERFRQLADNSPIPMAIMIRMII
jgi:PAS domain S-box-containing protein